MALHLHVQVLAVFLVAFFPSLHPEFSELVADVLRARESEGPRHRELDQ